LIFEIISILQLTPTACNATCQDCSSLPPTGGGKDYMDFCADQVIPLVLSNLSMSSTPDRTSMAGYSLGGLMGCWAPYLRPDRFLLSYCGSPSLWWNCEEFASQLVPSTSFVANRVYIDYGTGEGDDQVVPASNSFSALVSQGMIPNENLWLFASYGDYHETNSWKRRFWRAATDILL
jgi:predicted alpha/beta superfamily hydrolase